MKKSSKEFSSIDKNIARNQQRFFLLTNKDAFQRDIELFRNKWNIPQKGATTNEELQAWRDKHLAGGFEEDLNRLLLKYRLPPRWHDAVKTYLFTNVPKYYGPIGVWTRVDVSEVSGDEVSVILDAHTTRQDLIDAWPEIKYHLDNLKHKSSDKFQPVNMYVFERNRLAHELDKQGLNHKEIAKKLSEKYGRSFVYSDIPSMLKNYKRAVGTN